MNAGDPMAPVVLWDVLVPAYVVVEPCMHVTKLGPDPLRCSHARPAELAITSDNQTSHHNRSISSQTALRPVPATKRPVVVSCSCVTAAASTPRGTDVYPVPHGAARHSQSSMTEVQSAVAPAQHSDGTPQAPSYSFNFSDFLRREYRFGLDPNRPPCKAYMQGHCPLGNRCPDKHQVTNSYSKYVATPTSDLL